MWYHFSVLNSKAKQYLRTSSRKARHHLQRSHDHCRAALPRGQSQGPTPWEALHDLCKAASGQWTSILKLFWKKFTCTSLSGGLIRAIQVLQLHYWCNSLLSPGREALTLHQLPTKTHQSSPLPIHQANTMCLSPSLFLWLMLVLLHKGIFWKPCSSSSELRVLVFPVQINPPRITAWTSWEQAQPGLSSAAAHKESSGAAISKRRPTLRLEAASLLVYMTFIQTKTIGGEICVYGEMGGMLLEQTSRNSHLVNFQTDMKMKKRNAIRLCWGCMTGR